MLFMILNFGEVNSSLKIVANGECVLLITGILCLTVTTVVIQISNKKTLWRKYSKCFTMQKNPLD